MNVIHFSTHDSSGGAAISALRIHRSLLAAGVESHLVVRRKLLCDDPTIERLVPGPVNESPHFHEVSAWLKSVDIQNGAALARTRTMFSTYRAPEGRAMLRRTQGADVVHIHWVGENFLDYRVMFGPRGVRAPVVWRMPDLNAMTGGCHYPRDCLRYMSECGQCPALESSEAEDFSYRVQLAKKMFVGQHPGVIHYAAPTRWLARQVVQSPVAAGRPCTVIYNSVDTECFRPGDGLAARLRLGLPEGRRVILFVAVDLTSKRKGLDVLRKALAKLRGDHILALVGRNPPAPLAAVSQVNLGNLDHVEIAAAYRAADLVVVPSLEDNLPNVIFEAFASGRPVVASRVGGIPELVTDEVGRLVAANDVDALATCLSDLLADRGLLAEMGDRARAFALDHLSVQREREAYMTLYETVIDEHARRMPDGSHP